MRCPSDFSSSFLSTSCPETPSLCSEHSAWTSDEENSVSVRDVVDQNCIQSRVNTGQGTDSKESVITRFNKSSVFFASSEVHFGRNDYLGQGSISFVFKAQFKGKAVAAKIMRTDRDDANEKGQSFVARDFVDELTIVEMRFSHPNILGFVGASTTCFDNVEVPVILYEYVEGGSFEDLFERKQNAKDGKPWTPPSDLSLLWCRQLFEALAHLHNLDSPLAHRDIKPANLLVSGDMQTLKLADFSLAKRITTPEDISEDYTAAPSIAGSLRYMAPELLTRSRFDLAKADVYSAALTCWFLVHGTRPFASVADGQALALASEGQRPHVEKVALGFTLAAAWDVSPAFRPSADQMRAQLVALQLRKSKKATWGRRVLRKVRSAVTRVSA